MPSSLINHCKQGVWVVISQGSKISLSLLISLKSFWSFIYGFPMQPVAFEHRCLWSFALENWIISCFSLRVGGWDGCLEGRCVIDSNSFFPDFLFLLNTHLLHSLYVGFHLTVQQSEDWGWVRWTPLQSLVLLGLLEIPLDSQALKILGRVTWGTSPSVVHPF